ncbi:hypothetical protein PROFUN_11490 [Planoprotostelium fungivorum]|uniref:Uncharacterized protein n=1 Tax=Planoprotostelium fungivorum TaxID=1890364 RepID=A0A2P6N9Y5_9EUKA|nr:hypothetical protein PROFUN_11490 [Planoprotostelium fungivorum]
MIDDKNPTREKGSASLEDIKSETEGAILVWDAAALGSLQSVYGGLDAVVKHLAPHSFHQLEDFTALDPEEEHVLIQHEEPKRLIIFLSQPIYLSLPSIQNCMMVLCSLHYSTIEECIIYSALNQFAQYDFHQLLEGDFGSIIPQERSAEGEDEAPLASRTKEVESYMSGITESLQRQMRAAIEEGVKMDNAFVTTKSCICAFIWLPILVCTSMGSLTVLSNCDDYLPDLFHEEAREKSPKITSLYVAHALHSVAKLFGVREDIYSLGENSKNLGRLLNRLVVDEPSSQLSSEISTASFLMVDRTLDLVGACGYSDNLMDRSLYNTFNDNLQRAKPYTHLPPLQSNMTDYVRNFLGDSDISAAFNIYSGRGDACDVILQNLMTKREKEGLQDLRYKMMGNVTAKQLTDLVNVFVSSETLFVKHQRLVALAVYVLNHLKHKFSGKWDQMLGIEKILMLEPTDLMAKIREVLIKNVNRDGLVSLEDVIGLMLSAHSLGDPHKVSAEDLLCEEIIVKMKKEGMELKGVAEGGAADCRQKVEEFIRFLRKSAELRRNFKEFGELLKPGKMGNAYESLLCQIARSLSNKDTSHSRTEVTDIERMSSSAASSIGNIFKSGFSRFGLTSKPRVSDNGTIFLMLLGGITNNELRELIDIASKDGQHRWIIITTSLTNPAKIVSQISRQFSEQEKAL